MFQIINAKGFVVSTIHARHYKSMVHAYKAAIKLAKEKKALLVVGANGFVDWVAPKKETLAKDIAVTLGYKLR